MFRGSYTIDAPSKHSFVPKYVKKKQILKNSDVVVGNIPIVVVEEDHNPVYFDMGR